MGYCDHAARNAYDFRDFDRIAYSEGNIHERCYMNWLYAIIFTLSVVRSPKKSNDEVTFFLPRIHKTWSLPNNKPCVDFTVEGQFWA